MEASWEVVEVPRVGSVIVVLDTYTFGLTPDTVTVLSEVRRPDGRLVSHVDHERTAAHLEDLGLL